MKHIMFLLLAVLTLACTASEPQQAEAKKPTNIIFSKKNHRTI